MKLFFRKTKQTVGIIFFIMFVVLTPAVAAPPRFLETINNEQEFRIISRTYFRGRLYSLPHVMFAIDRQEKGRVYYINSKLFTYHEDFIKAQFNFFISGVEFFKRNYLYKDRRFLLGTIAYQKDLDRYTFEFWEGDALSRDMAIEAYQRLQTSFFKPLSLKINSLRQEEEILGMPRKELSFPVLTLAELNQLKPYQPITLGERVGRLKILTEFSETTVVHSDEIVVLEEAPLHITPVSGLILVQPTSPLSHLSLLSHGWSIPMASIKDAKTLFRALDGQWVKFNTDEYRYDLRLATNAEVKAQKNKQQLKGLNLLVPRSDVEFHQLTDLKNQRAGDSIRFGAKSANLGEVAQNRGFKVPLGFTIPFSYYHDFIRSNHLDEKITTLIKNEKLKDDPVELRKQLSSLRKALQKADLLPEFRALILQKIHSEYAGKGVFVRSSTNAEDLSSFSGAGLYTTVPNVTSEESILEAIKTVWASVWNDEAWMARERAGIDHASVYPAVLIQEAMPATCAGVMITANPFDAKEKDSIFLSAKQGLGLRVVDGRKIPEQVLYKPLSDVSLVVSRSDDDQMSVFENGEGVRDIPTEKGKAVLPVMKIRELSDAGRRLKKVFGGKDQDVEWLYVGDILYIVQSRPYVKK